MITLSGSLTTQFSNFYFSHRQKTQLPRSISIQHKRTLRLEKSVLPISLSQTSNDKLRPLDYAISNWLAHTSNLDGHKTMWEAFKRISLGRLCHSTSGPGLINSSRHVFITPLSFAGQLTRGTYRFCISIRQTNIVLRTIG